MNERDASMHQPTYPIRPPAQAKALAAAASAVALAATVKGPFPSLAEQLISHATVDNVSQILF